MIYVFYLIIDWEIHGLGMNEPNVLLSDVYKTNKIWNTREHRLQIPGN